MPVADFPTGGRARSATDIWRGDEDAGNVQLTLRGTRR